MDSLSEKPRLLWIDLRVRQYDQPNPDLSDLCDQSTELRVANIDETIRRGNPQVLCFDFDFPNAGRLRALQRTKDRFPSLPIFMLTVQHSEDLAIWAFRTGVRDFLVKPIKKEYVMQRIDALLRPRSASGDTARCNLMPLEPVPLETRFVEQDASIQSTSAALAYIEAHLEDPISLGTVAAVCNLDRFQFCRNFKSETGMTFRHYLCHRRIERAKNLLLHPLATVSDVAFTVGFNDPSHFTRMFNRHVGCAPSVYRMTLFAKNAG